MPAMKETFFVAADGVDLASQRGFTQNEPGNGKGQQHDERRYGQTHDKALTKVLEQGIVAETADRIAVGIDQRQAAINGHGGQCSDKGCYFAISNDQAVESAKAHADEAGCKDRQHRIHAADDQAAHQGA